MVSHALAVEQRFEPRVQVRQAHSGEGHSLPILAMSISDDLRNSDVVVLNGACSMTWPSREGDSPRDAVAFSRTVSVEVPCAYSRSR